LTTKELSPGVGDVIASAAKAIALEAAVEAIVAFDNALLAASLIPAIRANALEAAVLLAAHRAIALEAAVLLAAHRTNALEAAVLAAATPAGLKLRKLEAIYISLL